MASKNALALLSVFLRLLAVCCDYLITRLITRGSDLFTKAIAVLKDHYMNAKWADIALGKRLTTWAGDKKNETLRMET